MPIWIISRTERDSLYASFFGSNAGREENKTTRKIHKEGSISTDESLDP